MRTMMLSFVCLLSLLGGVSGARLLLLPGPATSHCLEMMSVGEELLKRGHSVTLLPVLFDPKHCISRFNITTHGQRFKTLLPKQGPSHQQNHDDIFRNATQNIFKRESLFIFLAKWAGKMLTNMCDAVFYDKASLLQLKDDKYDLAMVEAVPFTSCLMALPKYLGVPYVGLGSIIDPQDSKMPLQTNIFPNLFTEFSNEMTFIERTINTILFVVNPVVKYFVLPSVDLAQYDSKLAGLDARDLVKDSLMFLENSDYVVDYPKALFPNFVQVGALTAGPARPLKGDLKKYMDNSKDGVVLVTFGSMLKNFPKYLVEKLISAFQRLEYSVLFKQESDFTKGNVKVLKWVPQNDVLAHPNTKLFISHCGKNGFWEGVYHGVPIICMAIHAETHTTKVKVKKYGIGSSINIYDDTVDEFVKTINSVLNNETIYKNMKRISTLLRDRPENPRQRAASAIEHVLKYGGDHMRPPSVKFGFLGYTNLDVWIVLFGMDFAIIIFFVWLVRRCCCRSKSPKSKTE